MLKLRLSRGGTKKRPVYKVVVADSRFARDGRFIEKVGFFNPLLPKDKKERIGLEAERIKYWLGQGAQPTTRVARILGENQLMPMPANSNNPQKAVPKKDRKKEGSEEAKKLYREYMKNKLFGRGAFGSFIDWVNSDPSRDFRTPGMPDSTPIDAEDLQKIYANEAERKALSEKLGF